MKCFMPQLCMRDTIAEDLGASVPGSRMFMAKNPRSIPSGTDRWILSTFSD